MKFLIHKRIKTGKKWKGLLPPLGSLQLDQPLLDCGLPLLELIVQTNHMCCQIGVFSFLYIPITSAFVPMPCFYQRRLEGTPLDLPIANEIYASKVKLQNFSAQSSIGLSKLWSC